MKSLRLVLAAAAVAAAVAPVPANAAMCTLKWEPAPHPLIANILLPYCAW